jgi:hypothetical protein
MLTRTLLSQLAPGVPFCQFGPISGGGDPGYEACRSRSKKAMISATAAGSLIVSGRMSLAATAAPLSKAALGL